MPYFHLNARRAKILKQQLRTADSTERTARRCACARELLYVGQTKAAARQLRRLIGAAGLSLHRLSTKKKLVFEQLALFYLRLGEQQNCPEDRLAALVGDGRTLGDREPTMLRITARSQQGSTAVSRGDGPPDSGDDGAGPGLLLLSRDRTSHAKPRPYQIPVLRTLSISYIFDPSRNG